MHQLPKPLWMRVSRLSWSACLLTPSPSPALGEGSRCFPGTMTESAIDIATVCLRSVPGFSDPSQCLPVILSARVLMLVDVLLECTAAHSGDFQFWRRQHLEHTCSLGCYRRRLPASGESDRSLRMFSLGA